MPISTRPNKRYHVTLTTFNDFEHTSLYAESDHLSYILKRADEGAKEWAGCVGLMRVYDNRPDERIQLIHLIYFDTEVTVNTEVHSMKARANDET